MQFFFGVRFIGGIMSAIIAIILIMIFLGTMVRVLKDFVGTSSLEVFSSANSIIDMSLDTQLVPLLCALIQQGKDECIVAMISGHALRATTAIFILSFIATIAILLVQIVLTVRNYKYLVCIQILQLTF